MSIESGRRGAARVATRGQNGAMRSVAFFRNVNQGQRGHASTRDLVDALAAEGAEDIVPFQSNGTIVFTAAAAAPLVDRARERLALSGVFDDAVEVRSFDFVERIVAEHGGADDGRRRELTLFDVGLRVLDASVVLRESLRRRCAVVAHDAGWAVVVNDHDRQSNGTPTIEAVLGASATSRGLPTLGRLIDRLRR